MIVSNKVYDILKHIVTWVLPALATLVITLGEIWGWGWSVQVSATITAITTFLGASLCIGSKTYKNLVDAEKMRQGIERDITSK